MDYQPNVPGSQNTNLCHSVFPQIYFSSGHDTCRPTEQSSSTTPSAVAQYLVSQHLSRHRTSDPEDKISAQEDEVLATRDTKSTRSKEFVQRFRDWYSGEEEFSTAEVREKVLTMQIPMRDFLHFRQALNVDEDEKLVVCSINAQFT